MLSDIFKKIWSGKRDSNSRPPPWQGGALPLSYFRMTKDILSLIDGDVNTKNSTSQLNALI